MVATIYRKIVNEGIASVVQDEVIDCAIGKKTIAVESPYGVGIAMRYDRSVNDRSRLSEIERFICQMRLTDLMQCYLKTNPLYASIGLAALNSVLVRNGHLPAPDYYDLFKTSHRCRCLGLVGYFTPIVHYAREHGCQLHIFELRNLPDTLSPEVAKEKMPECDTVILTGSAFANRSIHHYFPYISKHASVYILGPSTPIAHCLGRFYLGSSCVLNRTQVLDAIRHDASCGELRPWLRKTGCHPSTVLVNE